ncbi:Miro-like protein [Oesophagostomum dentatum]|uniref:Miro-like protein n=1 Tax=Oesophagostomum dentatum TaxID=61180 RepID=A0A0B1T5Z1_OESDE|nr:Miro-like protein [Oesophagostomum dentatum]
MEHSQDLYPSWNERKCQTERRIQEPRTDVWPEPKPAIDFDEKFLRLPGGDEYKRVRQFKIDEKGAVVSRGDSFRRKRSEAATKSDNKSPSPYLISGSSDSARESRSESVSSSEESRREAVVTIDDPSTSHKAYKVYVVGDTGTGKSSLIGQLITSEYKNAFADEIQDYENTGDATWLTDEVDAFVVIYSIDSRRSWKQATMAIEMIRDSPACRNLPIVVAGNKADLERKRTVTKNEVRTASAHFGFEPLEISVALDHDVDDLLVSLVAELKEAYAPADKSSVEKPSPRIEDDFHAAIRRYSQRKKKALPEDVTSEMSREGNEVLTGDNPGKCSVLSPTCIFNKFKSWKKGASPRLTT